MGNKIMVDPAKLETTAGKLDEYIANYKKTYAQLFTEVGAMGANWQGADNLAYTNQIKGFEEDFAKMSNLMTEYANFLRTSAKTYRTTQADIESAAKRLTN